MTPIIGSFPGRKDGLVVLQTNTTMAATVVGVWCKLVPMAKELTRPPVSVLRLRQHLRRLTLEPAAAAVRFTTRGVLTTITFITFHTTEVTLGGPPAKSNTPAVFPITCKLIAAVILHTKKSRPRITRERLSLSE